MGQNALCRIIWENKIIFKCLCFLCKQYVHIYKYIYKLHTLSAANSHYEWNAVRTSEKSLVAVLWLPFCYTHIFFFKFTDVLFPFHDEFP